MTCVSQAPSTIDEWLSLVDRCAAAAGGDGWAATAMLGAQAAVLLLALAVVVGYVVGALHR